MKILMVSKACYVAVYRKKLEELAALPGVDLTLIVPPYWKTGSQRAKLEPGMDSGYRIIVDNPVLNGKFHLHFYRRMGHFLEALRPDLLHIDEEPYDLATYCAVRSAQKAGVRTVFFTWQNIERRFPRPFRWFEAYVLKHSSGAIAGNKAAAGILRNKEYRKPLTVIPQFGIDPDLYSPAVTSATMGAGSGASLSSEAALVKGSGQLEERPFQIGYVGRLVPEKGIMVLLEAAAGLSGHWRLSIRGDGPLRAEIEQACDRAGLGQRVEFGGWVPSAQVPSVLRELDVLVLPSLTTRGWMEQFGRVLVEAMACEVPVVGSDSGEIPQVIGDGGLIAKESDVADLRRQLQILMDDPAQRRRLAERGRERALQRFTQKQVAGETLRFYQEILNTPGVL